MSKLMSLIGLAGMANVASFAMKGEPLIGPGKKHRTTLPSGTVLVGMGTKVSDMTPKMVHPSHPDYYGNDYYDSNPTPPANNPYVMRNPDHYNAGRPVSYNRATNPYTNNVQWDNTSWNDS